MSVTAIHLLYKKEFEPIVRPLENVALIDTLDERRWTFGRVLFVEPIQEQVINLGPLSAADPNRYPTQGTSKELTELKIGENEFAQYRILVIDDFLLEVKQPSSASRFTTRTGVTRISMIGKEQMREIFVYEDNVPTVVPYSILFKDLALARIKVFGYRYIIEPLRERPREFTVIPVGGVSPKTA